MPNVLKVYLENGQTKAFKFEANTTVKDIILTLKEKLSIRSIDHFALVLEEQYNILKMYLLHEDERIEQVVQRKESHDFRCLFRVCFIPKDPLHLLQQDPVAFEYLYLQSCSDVLQERFAVEMKCSVALRLAALHIQERIITCAQPQKVSLKYIEKDWGIENFISPTLLRNMRGKDIKKAISFHMKRNQLLLDPRQKHLLSAAQVRLCYLQILGDLKLYGGKIFNATLMLQDRESCVALLVGAKYGISQVVNNKLNIITILAEFANISRLELTEESDKVSMVKIYLQDIKVLTLLLESNSAKDMACLISGYYRMFVDSSSSIYFWGEREPQMHRFSAEEGYESRTGSDSEESSEWDSSLDRFSAAHSPQHSCLCPPLEGQREQEEPGQERKDPEVKEKSFCNGYSTNDSWSEASDSANLGSRELKTSASSDSMDALEEDDLEACSSSQPEFFHFYTPTVQELTGNDKALSGTECEEGSQAAEESVFSFLLPTSLPLSTLAQPETQFRKESESCASAVASRLAENDAMEYYSLCANISPASSGERNTQSNSPECGSWNGLDGDEGICVGKGGAPGLILAPPPGFGDTSSDDEFYDTAEAVTPTEMQAGSRDLSLHSMECSNSANGPPGCNLGENILARQSRRTPNHRTGKEPRCTNSQRKRRSFLQTNYTSHVTFPVASLCSLKNTDYMCSEGECVLPSPSCSPVVVSLKDPTRDSNASEAQQVQLAKNASPSADLMEMEPDLVEMKSVADSPMCPAPVVRLQGAQESGTNSDVIPFSLSTEQRNSSLLTSCIPVHQKNCFSTSETPFQLEEINPTYKEKLEDAAETSGRVQEHCGANTGYHTKEALENKLGTAPPGKGVSYVLIEEIIHTTTKPPRSVHSPESKELSSMSTSDQDLLPAKQVEQHAQLLLGPCKRIKGDPILDEASQALEGSQLQENASGMVNEDSTQKSEGDKMHHFSETTEHCDGASGIVMRLSRLAFNSMVDCEDSSQHSDDKHQGTTVHSVPLVNQGSLKDDVLSQVPHHFSAGPPSSLTEHTGDQKPEVKDPIENALRVDYKLPHPLGLPTKGNMKQREVDSSDVLGFSFNESHKLAKPGEDSRVSKQSFLCSKHPTEDAKETFSTRHKTDRCSCQLTYASCFRGLDNEAELECSSPVACSPLEGPLTTPPSTRSPLSLDLNSTRLVQEHSYVNGNPSDCKNQVWLPETPIRALNCIKDRTRTSQFDFQHLLHNVVELQEILRQFWGNRIKHSRDECSAHFSEHKNSLYVESQRLMSSCQKVIKTHGPSSETQNAIQETFQNLLQLTEMCIQFTNCGLCSKRHKDLTINLRDVVCSYWQFVQAAKQAYDRGYPQLSIKLLVCQYTALTAALFCLVQQFRASSCI
ncbi:FERM and PDZ domain-containing protein 1 isoform X2 [Varanus komodoensis]|nr:FERM and PDZ domain-containing protein 1 isoform X2 [Varanus komodoensis]XP_044295443.1 FERM and PDZ domain-containing protein 1 isoform X2 [Varanus komodoensis]XP_044295444.1 FERM and PDZ domain-containing protein 1 isoform X2 [Varanus komodoensis]